MKPITTVLNKDQIFRATQYHKEHRDHVNRLLSEADIAFEPSEPEDKNDPAIWKPGYWKWFLESDL